jgi:uncharacterized membrane protein
MRARIRTVLRWLLALLLVAQGANHFVHEAFFVSMMPTYLPYPRALVVVSGVAEIVTGLSMLTPPLVGFGGAAAIALFVAVFPANVEMALHPERFANIPVGLLYARLPLQAVLMLWAYVTCLRRDAIATRRSPRA